MLVTSQYRLTKIKYLTSRRDSCNQLLFRLNEGTTNQIANCGSAFGKSSYKPICQRRYIHKITCLKQKKQSLV